MAIVLDEPSGFEVVINYALYGGALFQLICIFAVIFFPTSSKTDDENLEDSDNGTSMGFQGNQSSGQLSRKGRKEKKKHK